MKLNDSVRKNLAEIYKENEKTAEDDKLCEAYLRDYCSEYRREIAAIASAVRWGVPKSLRQMQNVPPATLRANLAHRLEENCGLGEESALWAVDCWAAVVRPDAAMWLQNQALEGGGIPARPDAVLQPLPVRNAAPVAVTSQPQTASAINTPATPISQTQPTSQTPAAPFVSAANAFVNGEKNQDLIAVQKYIKTQLKIRKQSAVMEELKAAGVAPGTAKDMVYRLRRQAASKGLTMGVLGFILSIVVMVVAGREQPQNNGLIAFGFLAFIGTFCYMLYSGFRLIRFS